MPLMHLLQRLQVSTPWWVTNAIISATVKVSEKTFRISWSKIVEWCPSKLQLGNLYCNVQSERQDATCYQILFLILYIGMERICIDVLWHVESMPYKKCYSL